MNNIFQNMVIPELGNQDFQQSFTDFCTAIKNNIERLFSVQYTKGDPGNSVYTQNFHIGYTNNELTVAGASFLHSIFGADFTPGIDRQAVCNLITGGNTIDELVDDEEFTDSVIAPSLIVDGTTYNVIPSFMDTPGEGIDVNINIDSYTGTACLSEPFIFIDGRISGLNKIISSGSDTEIYKRFVDFSIAVYGDATYNHNDINQDKNRPETWDWTFTTVAIVPKLYFDDNINEFCWNVNGQRTGITAQGIKGNNGSTPNMIIATGEYSNPKIDIKSIECVDDNGNIHWARLNMDTNTWGYTVGGGEYVTVEAPKDDDLALVFYNAPGNTNPTYTSAFIGKVFVGSTGPYVYAGFSEDGNIDIFESIRNFNFWTNMMSINANTVGSPRGYILPAYPDQSPASPNNPNPTHMIYAEKGNQDSEGYAKLHMAPVENNDTDPANNPTRMSQTDNPPTHHTGDLQVDYNVGIQGSLGVQGSVNIQGNTDIHGNTSVQGDMYIQGKVNAGRFTVLGTEFGTTITYPKLACLSKFKDINYSLKRTYDTASTKRSFSYTILLTGILELNIGELSAYGGNNSLLQPQYAIQGYGPNWKSDGDYSNANSLDHAQTNSFNNVGCKTKSKLYNSIRYEIPFSMSKTVSSAVLYTGSDNKKNIFGFDQVPLSRTWGDATYLNSRYGAVNGTNFNQISLRYAINGLNFKYYAPRLGSYQIGCKNLKSKDTNGSLIRIINSTNSSNYSLDPTNNTFPTSNTDDMYSTPAGTTPGVGLYSKGCISSALYTMQESNHVSPTSPQGERTYSINGFLQYGPLGNHSIDYHFDLYTRIFENDDTEWVKRTLQDEQQNYDVWGVGSFEYNIQLDITPVGYIHVSNNNNDDFYAPVWNNINVKDYNGSSIRTNMKELNLNKPLSFGRDDLDSEISYMLPSTTTEEDNDSILNSLITQKYTQTISCSSYNKSYVINGPTGSIMSGENIASQYIISPFEKRKSINDGDVEQYIMDDISTRYFDITNTIRMVENNVKICPNNAASGSWTLETGGTRRIKWESIEDIPVVIIPQRGYIGAQGVENGIYKMGCGNFKREEEDGVNVSLKGLLVYPHTPCIITLRDNDAGGRADIENDANTGGEHFISTGRMMGVSDGNVCGIATMVNSGNNSIPSDWNDIPDISEDDIPDVPIGPNNPDDPDLPVDPSPQD